MKPKGKSGRRISITLAVLVVCGAAAVYLVPKYFTGSRGAAAAAEENTQTRTVTVGTQTIRKTVSGSGEIVTGDEEVLTPDEDETVSSVSASAGKAVKKGDVLLTYDDDTTLTAPCNGVVTAVTVTADGDSSSSAAAAGQGGASASGSGSITIDSTDQMEVQLSVDETDLSGLSAGQAAEITVNALPDTDFTGKVGAIGETGSYSNGSSTFTVTVTLDKTDGVRLGMSSDVTIVIDSAEDAVAVPIEAVSGSGDDAAVEVVNSDGTVSPVKVELGLANDAYVQIVSGLSVGDKIQYTVRTSTGTAGGQSGFSAFGGLGGAEGREEGRMGSFSGEGGFGGGTGAANGGQAGGSGR